MLSRLPDPPPGKTGWPWTEESDQLFSEKTNSSFCPRISIVTPSLNQGIFIEETIRSIILQNYPNLEYIIIDGKSTDITLEIISKYDQWIDYWTSEPDECQSVAVNKGFKKCTGEYVNWICSDDLLCKNAINNLLPAINSNRHSLFIGKGTRIDRDSKFIDNIEPSKIKDFHQVINLKRHWRNGDSIMQQSCLYPLEALKEAGYLNTKRQYTMDYELWGKFIMNGLEVVQVNHNIGIFRWYEGQKTSARLNVSRELIGAAHALVRMNTGINFYKRSLLRLSILSYSIKFHYHHLRSILGIKRNLKRIFNVVSRYLHN